MLLDFLMTLTYHETAVSKALPFLPLRALHLLQKHCRVSKSCVQKSHIGIENVLHVHYVLKILQGSVLIFIDSNMLIMQH